MNFDKSDKIEWIEPYDHYDFPVSLDSMNKVLKDSGWRGQLYRDENEYYINLEKM